MWWASYFDFCLSVSFHFIMGLALQQKGFTHGRRSQRKGRHGLSAEGCRDVQVVSGGVTEGPGGRHKYWKVATCGDEADLARASLWSYGEETGQFCGVTLMWTSASGSSSLESWWYFPRKIKKTRTLYPAGYRNVYVRTLPVTPA